MAKHKAPKNFGGITHCGETYKAQRGIVSLPDDFPPDVAASHGLKPDDADEAGDGDQGADKSAGAGA